jgi:hypothetical protein
VASISGNRLTTATPYIRDLNAQIRKGEIKVPKFQRPFVWEPDQALALLDSVANNYPVGSLLLWRTAQKLKTERDIGAFRLPQVDDLTPTEYVLDGQQRLTVLYSVLGAPDDAPGFAASYDLDGEKFLSSSEVAAGIHVFPLRWLYETTKLLNFRTALQAHAKADELQKRFDALVDTFTSYQIPVVTLRDLSIEEVCPIFERINSSGTPLSIFDLMVAATWSNDFDLNDQVAEITLALKPKNYGDIKGTTVLKCLAAVQSDSVNRERILALRQVGDNVQNMNALVQKTQKALLRAVDQLLTDFKIYSLDFLPYEAHLVILTHILAKHSTLSAAQMKRMRQWFWRSSFAERYRGAPDSFVTRDLELVLNFVNSGKGAQASDFGEVPKESDLKTSVFRKNNSRSRAFTLALAKTSPLNLTNGSPVDTADALSVYNKKQFHHIFPEAFLRRTNPKVERSFMLNFCMLAASENNLISDEDPQVYLPKIVADLGSHADAVLRSNLMPDTSTYDYKAADLASFIDARLPVVRARIAELCQGLA